VRLHDFLDFHAREAPESEFASFAGTRLSYAAARAEANRIANALVARGLAIGDRVAFLAKNCLDHPLFFLGASKAGVVPVPLNYRLAPPEWEYIVRDSGARLLFARGELASAIAPIRSSLENVEGCFAIDARVDGWEDYRALVAAQPDTPPDRMVSPEDDLYQMYTSGTTGRPKGAIVSQRAVCSHLSQIARGIQLGRGERVLIVMPLYHAGAAITAFLAVQSAAALLIQEDFVPAAVVRALSEEGVVVALLVPAMIQACLVHVPDVAERRYPTLRTFVYGASPIAEATLRRALEVFACDFLQAYGMTETTAVLTNLMPADHRTALAGRPELLLSAGRPIAGTEIRIVDADDRAVAPGVIGEVCGRGPQLMRGYANLPEASKEALRGGWMHTGDAGRVDADGYLYIQDRVKDMIVSGGENIYPREIEDVLFRHPAVADAAVIGVPDERWGESVRAVVVLRAGASATPDEIIEFCQGQLAGYKRPRAIEFVSELPRNPSGKVLKRELRERHWAAHRRRVGGS
jgi:acyl-CoA synthetase (AMP-forming)/AMP-acid ligase II